MKSLAANNLQDFLLCLVSKNDFSIANKETKNEEGLNIYIRLISNYMLDYIDYYVDYNQEIKM